MKCVTHIDGVSVHFHNIPIAETFRCDNSPMVYVKLHAHSLTPLNAARLVDGVQVQITGDTVVRRVHGAFVENYKG